MLEILTNDAHGKIWSHVRQIWLEASPEEQVRQSYLLNLVNEYGYQVSQIAEEVSVTGRGSANARADFVVWRSASDKSQGKSPLLIVECKSDAIKIGSHDYSQGENYARLTGAPFFVTTNSRETRYWAVQTDRVPGYRREIENIPAADASDADVKSILETLRVFREKEFADVLHQCHNIIRNREKKDPAAAFDEIAKILFVKVYVERELLTRRSRKNVFSVDVLRQQLAENPLDTLFQETKRAYAADEIFEADERINLRPGTAEEIVVLLERYNLSDTSEDVKGVAFERFLGRTFRGEIGQFFTPRPVVDFMVRMIDPSEKELICDPASGSGGFLISAFEYVRSKVIAEANAAYESERATIRTSHNDPEVRARAEREAHARLIESLETNVPGSRLWDLARYAIYGTDANDRMARTSKMNMIMHGDGHGGVYHHDGFLDTHGIFEGRFDVVLANPPFGSLVTKSQVIEDSDIFEHYDAKRELNKQEYLMYSEARARLRANEGRPIMELFDLGRRAKAQIKTELLFIERCLRLLKPGGRLGLVLPEGIFNNPSLQWVRDFVQEQASIDAVISLPDHTFVSSGANVKCSILFLTKFSRASTPIDEAGSDDYAIFMYEAQEVGIGSTGETRHNELVPGDLPPDVERSCLELYHEFREVHPRGV